MTEFHVDVVRLGDIEKHPNADMLEITRVHGGYPCIVKSGSFKKGDLAVYIPIDTTLPKTEEFSFLRESERKRLKAKKLRGVFSMGLLIPAPEGSVEGEDVAELLGITKWEAPEPMTTGGDNEAAPSHFPFVKYTDIEPLRRNADVLVPGEEVVLTEKIHGANGRFIHDGERLWCGSRTCVKRDSVGGGESIWWKIAHELELEKILARYPNRIFFGEVYGNVQDLKYGVKNVALKIFDVFDLNTGRYLDYYDALDMVLSCGLEFAPILYIGPWNHEKLLPLCEGISELGHNIREGFVVKPLAERFDDRVGRVILKMHGERYLLRKQK